MGYWACFGRHCGSDYRGILFSKLPSSKDAILKGRGTIAGYGSCVALSPVVTVVVFHPGACDAAGGLCRLVEKERVYWDMESLLIECDCGFKVGHPFNVLKEVSKLIVEIIKRHAFFSCSKILL